jgi:hypothetical protein
MTASPRRGRPRVLQHRRRLVVYIEARDLRRYAALAKIAGWSSASAWARATLKTVAAQTTENAS